ncbi:hypothetical protein CBA19CS11_35665 [Caballeronia novacaledonica]|nr:hypothetical protein CBA19CS11_35665 [Caballeronia novacaledonica]
MTKSEYLSSGHVPSFIEWLSGNLDSNAFAHACFNRRDRRQWQCASLYDAFTQYHWPQPGVTRLRVAEGVSFESSALALSALRDELLPALEQRDNEGARAACVDVMLWGGVGPGNISWLIKNEAELVAVLVRTRDAIDADDTDHAEFSKPGFRFNAGMTKVYSLICRDFIIYDSRVAAALGWLVVKYCRLRGANTVPVELQFPWAPARAGTFARAKRRNAGEDQLRFPSLAGARMHVEWNMKASWLLQAVLQHAIERGSAFAAIKDPGRAMRALESALFMIGYDLDAPDDGAEARLPAVPTPPRAAQRLQEQLIQQEWESARMVGDSNARFSVTHSGIDIEFRPELASVKFFADQKIDSMLLYLLEHFATEPFPLANAFDQVRERRARNGMGTAWFLAANGNPPDTSRLAPVLEHVGILVRRDVPDERAAHWSINADVAARLREEGIRPWLEAYRQRRGT